MGEKSRQYEELCKDFQKKNEERERLQEEVLVEKDQELKRLKNTLVERDGELKRMQEILVEKAGHAEQIENESLKIKASLSAEKQKQEVRWKISRQYGLLTPKKRETAASKPTEGDSSAPNSSDSLRERDSSG